MTCRQCGCTDGQACAVKRGTRIYVCWWEEPNWCSVCALGAAADYQTGVRLIDDITVAGGVV